MVRLQHVNLGDTVWPTTFPWVSLTLTRSQGTCGMGTLPHFIDEVTRMRDSEVCLPAQRREDQGGATQPSISFLAFCPKIRAEKTTDETPWQHTQSTAVYDPPSKGQSGRKQGGRAWRGRRRVWLDSPGEMKPYFVTTALHSPISAHLKSQWSECQHSTSLTIYVFKN